MREVSGHPPTSGTHLASSELELFVMILDGLKKWDEAVEVMDTAEEDLLQQGTVQHRIMAMLMRAGKFQPVYDRAFSMLKEEYVLLNLTSTTLVRR